MAPPSDAFCCPCAWLLHSFSMQAVLRCCGCRSVTSAGRSAGTRVGASRLLSTMAAAGVPRPPPAYEASKKEFAVSTGAVGRRPRPAAEGRPAAPPPPSWGGGAAADRAATRPTSPGASLSRRLCCAAEKGQRSNASKPPTSDESPGSRRRHCHWCLLLQVPGLSPQSCWNQKSLDIKYPPLKEASWAADLLQTSTSWRAHGRCQRCCTLPITLLGAAYLLDVLTAFCHCVLRHCLAAEHQRGCRGHRCRHRGAELRIQPGQRGWVAVR